MTADQMFEVPGSRLRELTSGIAAAGAAAATARDLYLDLLKATLTGMIYEDPGVVAYWQPHEDYQHGLRVGGYDWPQHAPCMIGPVRLGNVQSCVETILADQVPGDLAECLPGDALVTVPAGRAVRAMRRPYSGPMIEITTAGGHQLTATPNHPVLTRHGWVPAGAVQEGGYVVSRAGLERMGLGHPHVDDVPAPIGEVFETLQRRGDERGPLHPVDLDVRARRGKVQVVTADRTLAKGRVAALSKPPRQQRFAGADLGPVPFAGDGLGGHRRFASTPALLGLRAESQRCLDKVRVAADTADHGIAPGMFRVSRPAHGLTDRAAVASVFGGEGTDGLPGEIAADRVVSVRTFPYSGHVFNLQTTTGWYNANNIIVHNCGVWRGGTTIFMRALLKVHGVTGRDVWVMDSFQGLPYPAAAADGFNGPEQALLAVSLDEVRGNFARYGMLDGQVKFVEGWFAESLPAAPVTELALLRMDADLYSSTTDILDCLYPKVSPGGFIIVDDWTLPARKATEDYRAEHGITDPVLPVEGADYNGGPMSAYWRKT